MEALDPKIIRLHNQEPGSLERKLDLRGDALWDIGCNLHEIFRHPGVFSSCPNANCLGLRQILNATQANEKELYRRT